MKCTPKPPLRDRDLLTSHQAEALADLFKVLAHDSRLRLLHAIVREREISVGNLADTVGMTPQAVSNQLQRLRGIVAIARAGNSIYYRIADPCIPVLLERGLCLMEEAALRRPARARV